MRVDIIVNGVAFVAGLAIGGGIGAYAMKRHMEKKRIEEDEEIQEKYRRMTNLDKEDETGESMPDYEKDVLEKSLSEMKDYAKETAKEPTAYNTMYKGEDAAEEEHPLDQGEEGEEGPTEEEEATMDGYAQYEEEKEKKSKPPRIISADKFAELDSSWEIVDLSYYPDEEKLIDVEDDDPDSEIDPQAEEIMIGDALTKYGFETSDEEVLYVQNFDFHRIYIVTKMMGAEV